VHVRDKTSVSFKGLEGPMTLYDVDGIAGPHDLVLARVPAVSLMPLDPPIPVRCYPIEEKTISKTALPGRIVQLSHARAVVMIRGRLETHANLVLSTDAGQCADPLEIYAKTNTIEPNREDPGILRVMVEFTFISEQARRFLDSLLGGE
jgi:hypothetical protein